MKRNKICILFLFVALILCLFVACDGLGGVGSPDSGSQNDVVDNPPSDDTDNPKTPTVCAHSQIVIDAYVAPTCEKEGLTSGSHCALCGEVLTAQEEIVALDHDFEYHEGKEPNCAEYGWSAYYTCNREGCTYSTYEVLLPKHELEHHEAQDPTCTEIGWAAYDTCKNCNYSTYKEKPALKHYGGTATCTDKAICNRCHEEYGTALGHDYGTWITEVPATCIETGILGHYHCSVCEENFASNYDVIDDLTITIDKNAHKLTHHNAQNSTCTEAGWYAYDTCNRCGYTTYQGIEANGHVGGAETCEHGKLCTTCGEEYTTALGHDKIHHDAQEPTCTEIGWDAYDTCSRCEYTTYQKIDALGHYGGTSTCTEKAICERCHEEYGEAGHIGGTATCFSKAICDRCHEEYGEVLGHDLGNDGACSRCKYINTGLEYELTDDGYAVTGIGTFSGTNLVIPEINFDGKPIIGIKTNAFNSCHRLISVTLPESLTSFGDNIIGLSFLHCYRLVEIYNKSSLTIITSSDLGGEIENNLFGYKVKNVYSEEDGSKLSVDENGCVVYTDGDDKILISYEGAETAISIPDGITEINDYVFYEREDITSVMIPNSVTSISSNAFGKCVGLEKILVADGNENFLCKDGILYDKSDKSIHSVPQGIKGEVTLLDGVTSIGNSAFSGCTGLTSITIPDSVTSIDSSAFSGCTALSNITISESVTSVNSNAFYNTAWYNNQPDGVVYAGKVAYTYKGEMTSDTSVEITSGTLVIGAIFGKNNKYLTSVKIPSSVNRISKSTFSGCESLTEIYFDGTKDQWYSLTEWSYFYDYSKLTIYLCDNGKLAPNSLRPDMSITELLKWFKGLQSVSILNCTSEIENFLYKVNTAQMTVYETDDFAGACYVKDDKLYWAVSDEYYVWDLSKYNAETNFMGYAYSTLCEIIFSLEDSNYSLVISENEVSCYEGDDLVIKFFGFDSTTATILDSVYDNSFVEREIFTYDDEGLHCDEYVSDMGCLTYIEIPSAVGDKTVEILGVGLFYGNCLLEKVIVPSTVKAIDIGAFVGCVGIEVYFDGMINNYVEVAGTDLSTYLRTQALYFANIVDGNYVWLDGVYAVIYTDCKYVYTFENGSLKNVRSE